VREWERVFADGEGLGVVVTLDYLEPELATINRAALREGRPWVVVKPTGIQPWLGPLFAPGETGCWECLTDRLRGYRSATMREHPEGGEARPLRLSRGAIDLSLNLAAGLLALELGKRRAGCPDSTLTGQVLSVDYRTLEVRPHRVIRRPQCPACGHSLPKVLDRFEPLEPLALRSRRKSGHNDNGHRARLAAETCRALAHHLSPITGAVGDLERMTDIPEFLGFHFQATYPARVSLDYLAHSQRLAVGVSGGKGRTETQARASAIGECLERYSARFEGHELRVQARFAEVREVAIHPREVGGYSENQYREREVWNHKGDTVFVADPYDEETEIAWTPAWSLTAHRWKLVPSCYVYMNYPPEGGRRYARGDSNGLAAGNCLEEAIVQGFLELVERDAVGIWWYNRVQRPALDLDSLGEEAVRNARAGLREAGRDLHVLDLTHDLNIPAFTAVSLSFADPLADPLLGCGAHFDARIALSRALTELGQSWRMRLRFKVQEYSLRFQDRPLSEMDFLQPLPGSPPRPGAAFVDPSTEDFLADLRYGVNLLQQIGLETLVVDLTRPDLDLNVARVIVPGLRHFWPRFAPGRLYDVPVALGWRERPLTEEELNPIPFYF
jgi:ribosomal protein S12 methylthiotransferase accessory factor